MVTGGYDRTIRFWEALSGINYRTIQYPDSVGGKRGRGGGGEGEEEVEERVRSRGTKARAQTAWNWA